MNEYTVQWGGINISANSPREAAELANAWISDPDSLCHVYVVTDEYRDEHQIDLDLDEED